MKFRNAHACAKHHKYLLEIMSCYVGLIESKGLTRIVAIVMTKPALYLLNPLQVFPNRTLWKNYKVPNSSASQWMVALISLGMT